MKKARYVLVRRWPVVVAALAVGMVVAWITRPDVTSISERWSASRLVTFDLNQGGGDPTELRQAALQVADGPALDAAAADLGRTDDPEALADQVEVTADVDSLSLKIAVTAGSEQDASDIVNAFAEAFVSVSAQEDLDLRQKRYDAAFAEVEALEAAVGRFETENPAVIDPTQSPSADVQADYVDLDRRYREALAAVSALEYDVARGGTFVVQPATPARQLQRASTVVPEVGPGRWIGLAGLATFIGIVAVWILEKMKPRLDLDSEVVEALGLPLLGEIGSSPPRRVGLLDFDGDLAEEYRRLGSVIRYLITLTPRPGNDSNSVVMFVSAEASEGKSTSTALAAYCLAESGTPTLALGCDFRRPTLDVLLGVERQPGIVERAEQSIDRPELADVVKPGPSRQLWVAPAGESTRLPIGCNDVARELIAGARADGVAVIIDSAPLLVVGDAVELLDAVDEVIMVVRPGRTHTRAAVAAVEMVRENGSELRGVVLVGSRQARARLARRYSREYYRPREGAVGSP